MVDHDDTFEYSDDSRYRRWCLGGSCQLEVRFGEFSGVISPVDKRPGPGDTADAA